MIKRVIRAATAALGILAALNACQQDRTATATPDRVPDGYVALRFDAEIPAMQVVKLLRQQPILDPRHV